MAHGVIIHLDDKCACWLYIYNIYIYIHAYHDISSKVKIGLMWASEQCYGEIMRSAQSLGLDVDNFTENLKQLKGYVRRRRRHVKLDDNLYQQKFVTVEDIKVSEPYADSPCAELATQGKDRSSIFTGHLRSPRGQLLDNPLDRLGVP